MISSWSTKRRFLYGGGVLLFVGLIAFGIFWKLIYRAPTCSDGIKNGEESGIDCGGACKNICTSDTLPPIVYWAKAFNIAGDVYNLAAYVENPNNNSKDEKAQYEFRVFDANNILIDIRKGEVLIPKNKRFIVFEPGFVVRNNVPKRTDFVFTSFSQWQKDVEVEPEISINHGTLISTSTSPRIEGTISNLSNQNIDSVELVATVTDSRENVIAVSRTFIDNLINKTSQDFVFTWPKPFNLGVEACTVPVDVALVLDRSGSMQSEGINPPEPFTTVKNTAKDFIKSLTPEDMVSVISFGTDAKLDSALLNDKEKSLISIDNLFLSTTTQQTNITDAFGLANRELDTTDKGSANKVMILLTDGVPTEPVRSGEVNYPKTSAQIVANQINKEGIITIYTIGLGKDVSDEFLTSLVSEPSHYFRAPTKENLSSIYKNISSSLCVKKPSVVNVIYRILPVK